MSCPAVDPWTGNFMNSQTSNSNIFGLNACEKVRLIIP